MGWVGRLGWAVFQWLAGDMIGQCKDGDLASDVGSHIRALIWQY